MHTNANSRLVIFVDCFRLEEFIMQLWSKVYVDPLGFRVYQLHSNFPLDRTVAGCPRTSRSKGLQ